MAVLGLGIDPPSPRIVCNSLVLEPEITMDFRLLDGKVVETLDHHAEA